jgi:hypothetical protein
MMRRSDHANRRTAGTWTLALGLLVAAHTVPAAGASGLDDLRAALEGLRGTVPLKVTLTAQVTTVSKDDDDKVRNASGTATLAAEDGPQGLRLAYPRDIIVKAVAEGAGRQTDSTAPVPTRNALNELDYADVHSMVHAAETLLIRLEGAKLKAERAEAWNGRPARLLSLELTVAKNQQFVDKQSSTMDIWIDEAGRPLASRAQSMSKGSAYIVVSFEVKNREDRVYTVVGDRLLVTRRDSAGSGSGAGQRGDTKATVTLQPGL